MPGIGIKVFTDEMITPRLSDELMRRGYDIESCRDAGRANHGIPDEDQLRYCARVGRTIYTFNTADFDVLDRRWHAWNLPHAGIIVSEDLNGPFDEMVRRLPYHLDAVTPALQADRLFILSR